MCGLTGFLGGSSIEPSAWAERLHRMADRIVHRGPDASGIWFDAEAGIGLAHRRLSIVDLSAAGAQPMAAPSGRYVLVYNGEVYNHQELRSALRQHGAQPAWRGHSDTESLLAGFDAWGIEATLQRAVGMFAMAIWDRERRELALARDRLGEKPLYYGWQGAGAARSFLFGSELKAMRAHPAFDAPVDRSAVAMLLRHNYIGAPWSIHEGIGKLPPGHMLTLSLARPEIQIRAYWTADTAFDAAVGRPFEGTPQEATDELERTLRQAIAGQMVADVPLGAFLSGGIDSSTVVALMQVQSSRPVRTFTIGSDVPGYDEAAHAKQVAAHLRTDHTELVVSAQDALAVIPRLPSIYCEPFADSSQVPTYLVSQLARRHVTVALSGDGADELLAGYNRYRLTEASWHRLRRVPLSARRAAASLLTMLSPAQWNALAPYLPGANRFTAFGDKVHKGAAALACGSADDVYARLVSHDNHPTRYLVGNVPEHACLARHRTGALTRLDDVQRMMALDALTYLPDDIMAKVDRASMAVSLETRAPFLDHRVFELAWRMPLGYKLREGTTKWLLRQVLYRHVPRELVERPKSGFSIPLDTWLRGPLREWAESLLDPRRLADTGYLQPGPVRQIWDEHLSGRFNHTPLLWSILMFQGWIDEPARHP
jgi:asparagine synthase (glutamine-hydrolysing)